MTKLLPTRRLAHLAVVAGLVAAVGVVGQTPASATYYNGGMPSAAFGIKPYDFNDQWQGPMDQARWNWIVSPTKADPYIDSGAKSWVSANQYSDSWYGLYTPHGSGSGRYFDIKLNARTIYNDASNFGNFVTSSFCHELGHALSQADNPPVSGSQSIMRYDRDRNTMTTPQQYDINGVNSVYGY